MHEDAAVYFEFGGVVVSVGGGDLDAEGAAVDVGGEVGCYFLVCGEGVSVGE